MLVEFVDEAVLAIFGIVSAQSQVAADMPLRQSLAQNQKSPPITATVFFRRL